MKKWAAGVDLGGTKIEVARIDCSGKLCESMKFPTHAKEGSQAVEEAIRSGLEALEKQVGSEPVGIGVGVAGQVELGTGSVLFAPNLEWHHVPLQDDLHKALDLPVIVTNDVKAATWGEWLHGAGKGADDLVCLFIGTGIGGGIVSDGKMLAGATNIAGELGHTVVNLYGEKCKCGNTGCLEAVAGGATITRRAQDAIRLNRDAGKEILHLAGGEIDKITTYMVVDAYHHGDPLASRLIQEAKEALIAACSGFANALNPSHLILGGGMVDGLPEIVEWIGEGIKPRSLKAATEDLKVCKAALKNEAGVVGAGALAIREFG